MSQNRTRSIPTFARDGSNGNKIADCSPTGPLSYPRLINLLQLLFLQTVLETPLFPPPSAPKRFSTLPSTPNSAIRVEESISKTDAEAVPKIPKESSKRSNKLATRTFPSAAPVVKRGWIMDILTRSLEIKRWYFMSIWSFRIFWFTLVLLSSLRFHPSRSAVSKVPAISWKRIWK